MSTHFSPDFLDFFKELAANNHKDWFDANRTRYEQKVKKPMENFVQDAIETLAEIDTEIKGITYKDCIFRINRDIRFSQDKTPYKLNRSAAISPNGKKDMHHPGIYFEMGPEHLRFYTGLYALDAKNVAKVRQYIAANLKKFETIISHPEFTKNWGPVTGEKSKTVDKSINEAAQKQALLFNKQFYIYQTFEANTILQTNLLAILKNQYLTAKPYIDFMRQAVL